MAVAENTLMEKLVALTKRRGFIFQSSELYGGVNGAWDYGPLGVELKRNLKEAWWAAIVRAREDVVGLDSSILMHPLVWKASGHVSNFADPMVDCKKCKKRYRVDEIDPEFETTGIAPTVCPDPKCKGELTPARKFNLMFETHIGPVAESAAKTWLRPETAQGIFANFTNVVNSSRVKVPFGASPRSASRSATRSIRATSPFARVSSSRWSWSSSASPAPTRNGSSTGWPSARSGTSSWG